MSGRKKKPSALRILEGNPGHRPINHDEPIPKKRAKGKAPDHIIDPIARDAWTEISNELNLLKITGSTDEKALEVLCVKKLLSPLTLPFTIRLKNRS